MTFHFPSTFQPGAIACKTGYSFLNYRLTVKCGNCGSEPECVTGIPINFNLRLSQANVEKTQNYNISIHTAFLLEVTIIYHQSMTFRPSQEQSL